MKKVVECALGLNGVNPHEKKEYTLFLAAMDAAKGKKHAGCFPCQ